MPPVKEPEVQEPQVIYAPPSIKGESTRDQVRLAEHLQKIGANFYGSYWCKFCYKQRSLFGAAGTRALPYVECAIDGLNYQRCPMKIQAYPSWEIKGEVYEGMLSLTQLQALSGFDKTVEFPAPPPPPSKPAPPPGGFRPPPVKEASSLEQVALAKHLTAKGAKFYGAHWCGYCGLQRSMFGAEAAAALPYVECDTSGYQNDAGGCLQKKVLAYPTWEIGGQIYPGYKSLKDLAELSGFATPSAAAAAAAIDISGSSTVGRNKEGCDIKDKDGKKGDC